MRRRLISGLPAATAMVVVAMLAGPYASAQDGAWYRPGLPEVMQPAGNAGGAGAVSTFRARYSRQKSPRIVVFWMRRLSDQIAAERRTVERIEDTVTAGALSGGSSTLWTAPGAAVIDSGSAAVGAAQRVRRREETTGTVMPGSADILPSALSQEAESAFVREFGKAGATVVDRAAILRLEGRSGTDPLAAEAGALADKADLLVEIMALPDGDSATGLLYRVDVKSTRDGRILTSFTTDGEPRSGTDARFTAKPGRGYVEAHSGIPIGQELAWQTMERLTEAWQR